MKVASVSIGIDVDGDIVLSFIPEGGGSMDLAQFTISREQAKNMYTFLERNLNAVED